MNNCVRELRKKNGWTQLQLGEELQVSRQTINAIENDRYDPSLSLAFSISRIFAQTIEDIFKSGKEQT
ncbi:MAG: helix-turn-helix transcriptional regulator [Gammaproteobacteria bacterium]|jgi:putative transcriptional regulator|nr:helix-turn-helix transcriptional regulator [Gammaproteobacteria bacterium]MBT5204185.1 helix-turn-helix transcriptional regulator [Gammaproteobacteria bacterium]MBT5600953.1 helix-turn-helix transcriptional regulator [Gammaproteobacteria bacterium]MBT6246717.1 helix-turn-helix transcriptional regulator [Gammaproteobacteria bacterium]